MFPKQDLNCVYLIFLYLGLIVADILCPAKCEIFMFHARPRPAQEHQNKYPKQQHHSLMKQKVPAGFCNCFFICEVFIVYRFVHPFKSPKGKKHECDCICITKPYLKQNPAKQNQHGLYFSFASLFGLCHLLCESLSFICSYSIIQQS